MTRTKGKVIGVNGNMVTVRVDGVVSLNEVGYVVLGDKKLKSEVIRIKGDNAELQVFEMTKGIGVDDEVEFSGELLAVELGPGLLGQIFDGLQNPLPKLAEACGFFLDRGVYIEALPRDRKWEFTPAVKKGDRVTAADTLGIVPEGIFQHRVMVPFNLFGEYTVSSVAEKGEYIVDDVVAELTDSDGKVRKVTMAFEWPVKRAIKAYTERLRADGTHGNESPAHRYVSAGGQGRNLLHSRTLRSREDCAPAGYLAKRGG